jgi:hypothetical protein
MSCPALARLFLTTGLLSSTLFAQEPHDITIQLRSATGSSRFQIGEVIPLEVLLSSRAPNRYLEPCAAFGESHFGYPQCRFFNHWIFTITPAEGWVELATEPTGSVDTYGGPAVPILSADLTLEASVFPYVLTHQFRFEKPGNYRVRLRMQVGLDDASTTPRPGVAVPANPHFVVVSGDLTLEIAPADPEWRKKVVREGTAAYGQPAPPKFDPPSAEYLHYEQATNALCNLGTPDATRALVDLLSAQHPEIQACLFHTTSIEAALDELNRLIADPDAAVNSQQLSEFQFLLLKLRETEVGMWPSVEEESEKLIISLPQKRGPAQAESLLTALRNPLRQKSAPFDQPHDQPFSERVIALVIANYDQFPWESQQWLLREAWPNLRSPRMLPLMRRLAEAGNGQALLRWAEFDSVAAADFMRKEVLRPAPRFSSFYLRLPEAELPEQEQAQLASNFVALTDNSALFNSATLLHRYASKRVLKVVLPFIDAKGNTLPDTVLFPALAYVLKVSPDDAAPRLEQLLEKTNREPWQSGFFTDIGFLQPSPLLEGMALSQIDTGVEPLASDAAEYLRLHGSIASKALLWKALARWQGQIDKTRAEQTRKRNPPPQEQTELKTQISRQNRLVADLRRAIVGAQAWMFTPKDAAHLQTLLQEPDRSQNATFGPGPGTYAIYTDRRGRFRSTNEVPEYMLAAERLRYAIDQYECRDLSTLKDKLLQFPSGSTFSFAWEFTAADQSEIVEISDFLKSHGYRVSNRQGWSFLQKDSPR